MLEYVFSQKGQRLLIYDGFMCKRNKDIADRKRLTCIECVSIKCKVHAGLLTMKLLGSQITTAVKYHVPSLKRTN